MGRKSQASLEFLTTYTWAFLVIAITIGALYYFGALDFSKFSPQKCVFPSQFKCLDFSLQPSNIKVRLINDIGENRIIENAYRLAKEKYDWQNIAVQMKEIFDNIQ